MTATVITQEPVHRRWLPPCHIVKVLKGYLKGYSYFSLGRDEGKDPWVDDRKQFLDLYLTVIIIIIIFLEQDFIM